MCACPSLKADGPQEISTLFLAASNPARLRLRQCCSICKAFNSAAPYSANYKIGLRFQVFQEGEVVDEDSLPTQPGAKYDKLNWLQAGVLTADKLLTVSPNYATEIAEDDEKGVELSEAIRFAPMTSENRMQISRTSKP